MRSFLGFRAPERSVSYLFHTSRLKLLRPLPSAKTALTSSSNAVWASLTSIRLTKTSIFLSTSEIATIPLVPPKPNCLINSDASESDSEGCWNPIRTAASLAYTGDISIPSQRRPRPWATFGTVPLPAKGSSTKSPGSEHALMMRSAISSGKTAMCEVCLVAPNATLSTSHTGFLPQNARIPSPVHALHPPQTLVLLRVSHTT